MAWLRSREPVLAKIRLTWVLTVASLTKSARAISRLDLPAAMRRSTSDSRGVRSVSAGSAAPAADGAAGARAAANSSRCCTSGSSTAWPAAAASTARPISARVASLVR
jgi:hypothetical protein